MLCAETTAEERKISEKRAARGDGSIERSLCDGESSIIQGIQEREGRAGCAHALTSNGYGSGRREEEGEADPATTASLAFARPHAVSLSRASLCRMARPAATVPASLVCDMQCSTLHTCNDTGNVNQQLCRRLTCLRTSTVHRDSAQHGLSTRLDTRSAKRHVLRARTRAHAFSEGLR